MIDYTIVALQLSTLLAVTLLAIAAFTVIGVSILIWLLGKLVEACWWLVEQSTRIRVVKAEQWLGK